MGEEFRYVIEGEEFHYVIEDDEQRGNATQRIQQVKAVTCRCRMQRHPLETGLLVDVAGCARRHAVTAPWLELLTLLVYLAKTPRL
jgi:hypothetical protein